MLLHQGSNSVSQYALDFRILVAECGRDQTTLQSVVLKGLSDEFKDELAARDETANLEEFVGLAISLDYRLREREIGREQAGRGPIFLFPSLEPYPLHLSHRSSVPFL